jgi:hypothetical protein
MFGYTMARRPALAAAATLTAVIAFAAPAAAARHQPTASPSACSPAAYMDQDENTGQVFAVGYTTCNVEFVATMRVNLWIDNTEVRGASQACPIGTDCYTSSGSIAPYPGRHRYCAQAVFYWAGTNPSQTVWSCEYLG